MRAQWGEPRNGSLAKRVPEVHDFFSPFAPYRGGDFAIEHVIGLDRPFTLDVIVEYDWKSDTTIVDACIDERRTMITRRNRLTGDQLFFFVQAGEVVFDDVIVRPILNTPRSSA